MFNPAYKKVKNSYTLFTPIPETIDSKSIEEISLAVNDFCKQNVNYNGTDNIDIDVLTKRPLIFFLMEQYRDVSLEAKKYARSLIREVFDQFPHSREAIYGGNIFYWCIQYGSFELLYDFRPSQEEILEDYGSTSLLEFAFSCIDSDNESTKKIVTLLVEIVGDAIFKSPILERIRNQFNDLFIQASNDPSRPALVAQMQYMVDVSYVELNDALIDSFADTSNAFDQGVWVRIIDDPCKEKSILEKREQLSDTALFQMGHIPSEREPTRYTEYSPSNFVTQNANYSLYDIPGKAGVIIDTGEGPFTYWQDGTGHEMLSKDMDFTQAILFNSEKQYKKSKQFSNIKKSTILEHIQKIRDTYIAEQQEEHGVGQVTDNTTHRSLTIPIVFEPRQWNEGLLRYKKSHVLGFYVDADNKNSVIAGVQLKSIFALPELSFYSFAKYHRTLHAIPIETLIERHGLSPQDWEMTTEEQTNSPYGPSFWDVAPSGGQSSFKGQERKSF